MRDLQVACRGTRLSRRAGQGTLRAIVRSSHLLAQCESGDTRRAIYWCALLTYICIYTYTEWKAGINPRSNSTALKQIPRGALYERLFDHLIFSLNANLETLGEPPTDMTLGCSYTLYVYSVLFTHMPGPRLYGGYGRVTAWTPLPPSREIHRCALRLNIRYIYTHICIRAITD